MFLSSVALYLFTRKAQLSKISIATYSLFTFAIPALMCLFVVFIKRESLIVPIPIFIALILTGFLLSYLGNFFSQRGILHAPNPGYSLIISKSYVVMTTLLSPFLFANTGVKGSAVFGIILIIAFSAVIILNNKKKEISTDRIPAKPIWVWYTIGAFLCWGFLALASKWFIQEGISIYVRLFITSLEVSGLIYLESLLSKERIKIQTKHILLLLIIGIFSGFFNIFMQEGFVTAPNPGYINAVNAASISVITIFSAILFNDDLNIRKVIGVIGVTIGLFFIFL